MLTLFSCFCGPVWSDDNFPTVDELVRKEGQFAWTDGSSYYWMKGNGTFESGPLGMGGRTIQGTWTSEGNLITVQGTWGRINGLSALHDTRKMVIGLSPARAFLKNSPSLMHNLKFHEAYFEIEELVKTKP